MRTVLLVSLALGYTMIISAQKKIQPLRFEHTNVEMFLEFYGNDSSFSKPIVLIFPGEQGVKEWQRDFSRELGESGFPVMVFKPDGKVPYTHSTSNVVSSQGYDSRSVQDLFKLMKKSYPGRKVVLVGFEEGVRECFELMTRHTHISDAFIVEGYPRGIKAAQLSMIQCRILGFYPQQNQEELKYLSFLRKYLQGNGKSFVVKTFKNVKSGFLNSSSMGPGNQEELRAREEILKTIAQQVQQTY